MIYTGHCYCGEIKYEIDLSSPDEARTSLCHCKNCKRFFGTEFGLTAKIPVGAFKVTAGKTKEHVSDNGSGTTLYREFCSTCGSGILEYGEPAKDKFRYIMCGTLDDFDALPPKGEFFCKARSGWMPEIPGIFHKQAIQE
ncbi:hypothetical protein MMC16_004053 [Acarospora aff. strigata]|nr:hypothetical protein [Acarospora aff. strigata]